ncbi:MAG: esterase-like activity of phytase family protein [Verrucomicrobia bacterium]|nr:esterase-like activity of phytase family protein [Verrucomicrobiota bacterium]
MQTRTPWLAALVAAGLLSASHGTAAITITDPGQGVYDFTANAMGLSGLTWVKGNVYDAVSDAKNQRHVYQLEIGVNPANGRVTKAAVTATHTLAAGFDLEGLAWCPSRGTFFIADEGQAPAGGYLREHTLPDGRLVRTLALPKVMTRTRANFSLESCTLGAGALWTANEEALAQESTRATARTGSLIRLQKFDQQLKPAGEWAYLTDSYGFESSLTTAERSGVADLLALPDGNLLVLERALGIGFIPSFRNRIYLVSCAGATDVSGIANLNGAAYKRVTKTLLWEKNLGSISTRNFEGIALGAALPLMGNSSYSVLLIADNGGGTQQHLYALVVNGVGVPKSGPAITHRRP